MNALAKSLVAAQAELHAPTKNRTVKVRTEKGSYTFDYATLDGIVENILRPILPKHGLWFVQLVSDGQMVTRIVHESGETMDCGVPMPNLPGKPQEAGSLLTYFKRYSLCAAFGLVAEEDDDANVASGNGYEAQARNGGGGDALISEVQLRELQHEADATGADLAKFCAYMRVPSLKQIPARDFDRAFRALQSKRQPQRKAA